VDDNSDFLSNFALNLEGDLAYRLFLTPERTLTFIDDPGRPPPIFRRWFGPGGQGGRDPLRRVRLSAIVEELYSEHRFGEVAVAVVDYHMPRINGLELCHHLRRRDIRTILLTGQADEKIAVAAFNDGLIDRFVLKGTSNLEGVVSRHIRALQQAYFEAAARPLLQVLGEAAPSFLHDAAFAAVFAELRARHGYVEYYLSVEPPGLLCLDAEGRPGLLVVCDTADLAAHRATAVHAGAPAALLECLRNDDIVPWFGPGLGHYRADLPDWRQGLFLAQRLVGERDYRWTLITDPDLIALRSREVLCYRYYLDVMEHILAQCEW
jgi:CheY-like chemotaxis protein